jgi:hypothetical protein
MASAGKSEQLSALIGDIYDATLDSSLWPRAQAGRRLMRREQAPELNAWAQLDRLPTATDRLRRLKMAAGNCLSRRRLFGAGAPIEISLLAYDFSPRSDLPSATSVIALRCRRKEHRGANNGSVASAANRALTGKLMTGLAA